MSSDREFVGFVWMAHEPVGRLSVWASSSEAAFEQVVDEYGDGHVIILYEEADAR